MNRALTIRRLLSFGVVAVLAAGPAIGGAQTTQTRILGGTARNEARTPFIEYSVQAREIDGGHVIASVPLDTLGNFQLPGLPLARYMVELLNREGDVVCTEGPIDLTQVVSDQRPPDSCGHQVRRYAGRPHPPRRSGGRRSDSRAAWGRRNRQRVSINSLNRFRLPRAPLELLLGSALFLVLMLGGAGSVLAQDAAESARIQLGPLGLTPTVALSDIGVDTNVFSEAVDPKRDWTANISSGTDLWLKVGPTLLSGKVSGQYLYFAKYASERVWGTNEEGKWEVQLSRVKPFVRGGYADTRDRINVEITDRVHRQSTLVGVGTDIAIGTRTTLVLTHTRRQPKFGEDQTFRGVDLATALNETNDDTGIQLRYAMTALTTFVVNADTIQDRFSLDPLRDSDSLMMSSGFELQPSALIAGAGTIGIRRFDARDSLVPDWYGITASGDLTYKLAATSTNVKVLRDVTYSYEATQPYYALTEVGVSVTQRVTQRWDVVARGTRGWLDYQALQSVAQDSQRTDHLNEYGGGFGYRPGRTFRIGVDAVRIERKSPFTGANYQASRIGGSISYVGAP